ncbi:hypothetical protein FM038_020235 [Shewanella eurypsychrophilus]|uniref:Uncharacterized protein n=2 Tax=Shewanella TaxID=22 RepID=A0ABX6VD27_9GAMM|nr:hypothetical protein [Shewanella eurypsychrophilus]QPG59454.2 hypothetical protein FM038_020235 [Shewanella eurypsychrophilus]
MSQLNHKINHNALSGKRAFSIQRVTTIGALLLLLVAVQVSTQNAGDWFVLGLNVLEAAAPVNMSINEISNVTTDFSSGLSTDISQVVTDLNLYTQALVIGVIESAWN